MRRSRPITFLAGAALILAVGLGRRRRPRIAAGMYGNRITGAAFPRDPVSGSSRGVATEGGTP